MVDEQLVREAAIEHVRALSARADGGAVPKTVLGRGLMTESGLVKLFHWQRGIHKPSGWALPLTLKATGHAADSGLYSDEYRADEGYYDYSYQGHDASNPGSVADADAMNALTREAMRARLPLILLLEVTGGDYLPLAPVLITGDDPARRRFRLDLVPDAADLAMGLSVLASEPRAREYRVHLVRHRVHQAGFRASVLAAYRHKCAVCSLVHVDLLEAAHIIADADGGQPWVSNGLSLCRLHHGAFDRDMLGITPDLEVQIHPRVLRVKDGPVHEHALLDLHGRPLREVPRDEALQPDRSALESRFARFRAA